MGDRQFTTPLFIQGGKANRLQRIPFSERFESEDWLQRLLHEHPQLLPAGELEPAASESVSIARELPTECGLLDLLFANADGFLTLVETKLWRNPEARRSVVAHLIDYAKELARWDYDLLVAAVRRATGEHAKDPLIERVRGADAFDEKTFVDAIGRNLRRGRFLLLIVGDGIQEGIEHMSDFLQQTPQLGFTLGLVEMGLYRLGDAKEGAVLVQPRILARTKEVARAVVELRAGIDPKDVSISFPVQTESAQTQTNRLTEETFLEKLTSLKDPHVVKAAQWLLESAPAHGLKTV